MSVFFLRFQLRRLSLGRAIVVPVCHLVASIDTMMRQYVESSTTPGMTNREMTCSERAAIKTLPSRQNMWPTTAGRTRTGVVKQCHCQGKPTSNATSPHGQGRKAVRLDCYQSCRRFQDADRTWRRFVEIGSSLQAAPSVKIRTPRCRQPACSRLMIEEGEERIRMATSMTLAISANQR